MQVCSEAIDICHSKGVIPIRLMTFRRNTTFDKNLDKLELDEMSLDELGIDHSRLEHFSP